MGFITLYILMGSLMGGYYALWQNELISAGYTVSGIAAIVSAQTVLSMILNVPTGILADKFGHKHTSQLGFGLYALAFLLPTLTTNPQMITLAIILVGVAGVVLEGALDAWATSASEHKDKEIKSARFIERDQAERIGMMAGALLIPASVSMLSHRLGTPWSVFFGLGVVLTASTFLLKDEKKHTPHLTTDPHPPYLSKKDWITFLSTPKTQLFFLSAFLFGMADGVTSTVFWPTVRSYGITSAAIFGVLQTSQSLSRLIGLHFWKKTKWTDHEGLPGAVLVISGLVFVAFAFVQNVAAGLALWFLRIAILSVYFSAVRAAILREEKTKASRATVLSFLGVVGSVGMIASTSLISIFSKSVETHYVTAAGGVLTVLAGVVLLMGPKDLNH